MGTTGFHLGSVTHALELQSLDVCKALGLEVEAVLSEGEGRILPVPWEQMRTAWNGLGCL